MSNDTKLVRTKTGNKLHRAGVGSSRTICGIRYGYTVRTGKGCVGCTSCGVDVALLPACETTNTEK